MSDNLAFLISDVSRLMRRRFDERARRIGVTRAQWRTLTALSRNEGQHQGALAELLDVEPITLCRMIDRLEEADMVERRRDPADRRAWRIFLTARAKPIITQLRSLADDLFVEAFDSVATADKDRLFSALETIRTNLNRIEESSEAAHG